MDLEVKNELEPDIQPSFNTKSATQIFFSNSQKPRLQFIFVFEHGMRVSNLRIEETLNEYIQSGNC